MGTEQGLIQPKCEACEAEEKEETSLESRLNASKGGGSPLSEEVRGFMEPRFGEDFSGVRIHTDGESHELNQALQAKAFTTGQDIYFKQGEFKPGNRDGQELLAHELTHVVQQTGGRLGRTSQRQALRTKQESAPTAKVFSNLESPLVKRKGIASRFNVEDSTAAPLQAKILPGASPDHLNQPEAEPASERLSQEDIKAPDSNFAEAPQAASELTEQATSQSPGNPEDLDATQPDTPDFEEPSKAPLTPSEPAEPATFQTSSNAENLDTAQLGTFALDQPPVEEPLATQADFSPPDASLGTLPDTPTDFAPTESSDSQLPEAGDFAGTIELPSEGLLDGDIAGAEPTTSLLADNDFQLDDLSATPNIDISSLQLDANPIQRSEDDDGGIFGGIRSQINSIVDGLRSGWSGLSGMAQEALAGISSQISGLTQGLSGFVSAAMSGLQAGWSSLSQMATQLANTFKQQVAGAVGSVMGAAQSVAQAVMNLDANALQAAWSNVTGLMGGIWQRLQQAGQAVFQQISGLWSGLQDRFNTVVSGLASRAQDVFGRLHSVAEGVQQRLSTAWEGLRNRASGLSGVLGGVLERLRSLVSRFLSWGQQVWGGIQQQWSGLRQRMGGVFQQVRQRVTGVWQGLQQRAAQMGSQLTGLWGRLQGWVRQQIQRALSSVQSVWSSLQNLSISHILQKLPLISQIFELVQELATNLRSHVEPVAQKATDQVYAEMPGSAINYGREQIARLGTPSGSPNSSSQQTGDTLIQRTPSPVARSTASLADISDGMENAASMMWQQLTRDAVFEMILNAILEQVVPLVAVYRQLKGFFTEDLPNMASGLYWPRNIFSDPIGSLHDIYTNLFHLVTDVAVAILHRVINILMAYQLWITITLTALGAIGGGTVVGILGGILGFLGGLGIGAGPGAAAGAGAGGAAGAGVGFGVSLLVGEAVFFAFLGLSGATILKLLIDLTTTLQDDDAKQRDYVQLVQNVIAAGVGLALLAIAWLAGVVARAVGALIKRLGARIPPLPPGATSRFARGAGSVNRPRVGTPPVEETAARLAMEQRLAPQVGDALAQRLVAELGPQAAAYVVERLGGNTVHLLGEANVSSQAIARIAHSGMRSSVVDYAVTAGQAERLAGMSSEQLGRFASLPDSGFARIIGLPEEQFQRFASLGEAQLRVFAGMDEAAFSRFALLDETAFSRFRGMSPERLEAFGRMSEGAFNRFRNLAPADFAKFENFTPEALERFGNLTDPAFSRFAALDKTALEKFGNVATEGLERFGAMAPARFNAFAQAEQTTIERFASLSDATFNRFIGESTHTPDQLNRLAQLDTPELENLLANTYEEVRIFGQKGALGEFDEISNGIFIEDKSARGLNTLNPRTGQPAQTPMQWAEKQIYDKTAVRIRNLSKATETGPSPGGTPVVPELSDIQDTIRHLRFRIEAAASPDLEAAVNAQLQRLSANFPDWTFEAVFGWIP